MSQKYVVMHDSVTSYFVLIPFKIILHFILNQYSASLQSNFERDMTQKIVTRKGDFIYNFLCLY